jgi:ethanolamine utilization protein EutP (predicted NTPase)
LVHRKFLIFAGATKVSQISGVDKKEVAKIMKELKKDETIYSPKRCYWTLKE